MNILGISAYYHDSAACLVRDGKIIAAAQEERFTRKKHDFAFPKNAAAYCLHEAEISINDVKAVVFYDKPFLKFDRILHTYLTYAPQGLSSFLKAVPMWIKQKIWMKDTIAKELKYKGEILFATHHQSHAASAFFPSPFNDAAILTLDGVGEWETASYGIGEGNRVKILATMDFPHSLGLLYSAFTYYCGFKVNSGEYKLMGLAPYGEARFKDLILSKLIDLKDDGSFVLNLEYFDYCVGLKMINALFEDLFSAPVRLPERKLTQHYMDVASSIQAVTEEIVLRMARYVRNVTGKENLCLAGGVALNCVANGKILKEKIFKNIWVQPAAGDAGGALGAALAVWYEYFSNTRFADDSHDAMRGSYLGPEYDDKFIEDFLIKNNIKFTCLNNEDILEKIARLINDGKVIGWFQGRMEFGPRALGNRSILGDARNPDMQKDMNLKIKFRESFRPFAPSFLPEKVNEWLDFNGTSPYMLFTVPVKKDGLPSVTHVDKSARVQTVSSENNPLFYSLLKKFDELYGCPAIINTSFNVRGEPIVTTPGDAYRCFMRTNIDYLMIGSFLLDKKDQPLLARDNDWRKEFELD
jgi:carbamoyltransferase